MCRLECCSVWNYKTAYLYFKIGKNRTISALRTENWSVKGSVHPSCAMQPRRLNQKVSSFVTQSTAFLRVVLSINPALQIIQTLSICFSKYFRFSLSTLFRYCKRSSVSKGTMYRSPNMDTTDGAFCGFYKDFFSKLWYCDVSQHRRRIGFIQFILYEVFGQAKLNYGTENPAFVHSQELLPAEGARFPTQGPGRAPCTAPAQACSHLEWGRAHCYYAVQKPSAWKENCNNDSDYLFFLLYFLIEHCIWKCSLILKISSIFINLCPFLIGTTERLETKQKFKENFKTAYIFVLGLLQ